MSGRADKYFVPLIPHKKKPESAPDAHYDAVRRSRWKKSEKKVIKSIGGTSTPASGATWWSKGDGVVNGWCVEVKGTSKDKFRVTESILKRLHRDAGGRDAMLIVHFKNFDNRLYFVVPEHAGEDLQAAAGSNLLEPYSPVSWFTSKSGTKYFVLPEVVAKIRLSLANS